MLDADLFAEMIQHYKTRYNDKGMDNQTQQIWWQRLQQHDNRKFSNAMVDLCGRRQYPFGWAELDSFIKDKYRSDGFHHQQQSTTQSKVAPPTKEESAWFGRLTGAIDRCKKSTEHPSGYWKDRYYRIMTKKFPREIYDIARESGLEEMQEWVKEFGNHYLQSSRNIHSKKSRIAQSVSPRRPNNEGALF